MAISQEKIARAKELKAKMSETWKEHSKLSDEYRTIESQYFDDQAARFNTMDLNDVYLHIRQSGNMLNAKEWPERAHEGSYIHIIKSTPVQKGKIHCIMERFDVGEDACHYGRTIKYGVESEVLYYWRDFVVISKEDYECMKARHIAEMETDLERLSNEPNNDEDPTPYCCEAERKSLS